MTWIVGRGAMSAFGPGLAPLLQGIAAGRCALRAPGRLADVPEVPGILGEVPPAGLPPEPAALPLHLARLAGEEALSGWDARPVTGLVLATTKAALAGVEAGEPARGLGAPGPLARDLARALRLGGARAAVSTACASGLSALALAGRWLAAGRARHVLVVGVDALSPFVVRGFTGLLALDPGPCRPFDRARRGLSLGEGAGALLLSAERRGPLRLRGWGEANDAHHVTGPRRDGGGLRLAAARALARAGVSPGDLDLVHLHGTGTPYNDAAEALALRDLCGGTTPPACGSKAALGHTLGASGVLESIVAGEALLRATAPANLRLADPDVDPALDLVRGAPRALPRARLALKLAAGFGGIDAALVLERC